MKNSLARLLFVEALVCSAISVAGSFVLIYLLAENFSYTDCGIFILLCYGITTLICFAVAGATFKSLNNLTLIGIFALLSYYLLFNFITDLFSLIFIAILLGTHIVFFWIPFNIQAVALTLQSNRGLTLGVVLLIFPLVGVILPTLGGWVINELGYSILFLIAVGLLIVDMIFVWLSRENTINNLKPSLNFRNIKSIGFGLFCQGAQEGIFVVTIPLIGFELTKSEFSLGILLSIFALTGAIMTVFLGYVSDKIKNRNLFLRIGALITAPLIILSVLSYNLENFAFYIALANLTLPIISCFLFVIIVDKLPKKEDSIITRELMLNLGRSVGALICVLGTFFLTLQLPLALSGIFVALTYFATIN